MILAIVGIAWGGGGVTSTVNAQTMWFQGAQATDIWTPYNVGIGTNSPIAKLHVVGTTFFDYMVTPNATVTKMLNVGYINIKASKIYADQYDTIEFFKKLIFYPANTPVAATSDKLIRFESPKVQFGIPGSSTYKVWVYGTLNTINLQAQTIKTNSITSNTYKLSGIGTVISPIAGSGKCSDDNVQIGGGICNDVVMFPEESQQGNGRVGIGTSSPKRKLHIMTNEKAQSAMCCQVFPGDIFLRQTNQRVHPRAGIRIEHILKTSEHITWDIVPAKDSRPYLTLLWANSNQPIFKFYNTGTFAFTKHVASNSANGTVTWILEPDAYKRGYHAFAKLRLKYHSELASSGLPTFTDTGTLVTFQANPKRVNISGDLYACGLIKAKEFKVELGWCDFVFHPDFERPSWTEIKEHYTQHHRLPMMPPADSVETHGLPIGQALKATVYNVELNRLDITDLYEQINALKQELNAIKEENSRLKQEIAQLKQNNQN